MIVYSEWSSCVKGFGLNGLMFRTLTTLNGCQPSTIQQVKRIRSCEPVMLLSGFGESDYLYGTDWIK